MLLPPSPVCLADQGLELTIDVGRLGQREVCPVGMRPEFLGPPQERMLHGMGKPQPKIETVLPNDHPAESHPHHEDYACLLRIDRHRAATASHLDNATKRRSQKSIFADKVGRHLETAARMPGVPSDELVAAPRAGPQGRLAGRHAMTPSARPEGGSQTTCCARLSLQHSAPWRPRLPEGGHGHNRPFLHRSVGAEADKVPIHRVLDRGTSR